MSMSIISKIKKLLKRKSTLEKRLIQKETLYGEKKKVFDKQLKKQKSLRFQRKGELGGNKDLLKLKDDMIELKKQIQNIKQQINTELIEKSNELNKDTMSIIKSML